MGVEQAGAQPRVEDSSGLEEERETDDIGLACSFTRRYVIGPAVDTLSFGIAKAMSGSDIALGVGRRLVGAETSESPEPGTDGS